MRDRAGQVMQRAARFRTKVRDDKGAKTATLGCLDFVLQRRMAQSVHAKRSDAKLASRISSRPSLRSTFTTGAAMPRFFARGQGARDYVFDLVRCQTETVAALPAFECSLVAPWSPQQRSGSRSFLQRFRLCINLNQPADMSAQRWRVSRMPLMGCSAPGGGKHA